MNPNNSGYGAREDEKVTDKGSRWALHRRKSHIHRGFQASTFDTDHQITLCVLTQHSTVGWHTVPWLHTAIIFCGTELCPCRYWSHSSNTMVKGKDVPVYTMKTYRGSTVTTALICNRSRKQRWVIRLMQQLIERLGRINKIHWIKGQMDPRAGLMYWREGKSPASANKQTTCGPASRLSLYWLSCHTVDANHHSTCWCVSKIPYLIPFIT